MEWSVGESLTGQTHFENEVNYFTIVNIEINFDPHQLVYRYVCLLNP